MPTRVPLVAAHLSLRLSLYARLRVLDRLLRLPRVRRAMRMLDMLNGGGRVLLPRMLNRRRRVMHRASRPMRREMRRGMRDRMRRGVKLRMWRGVRLRMRGLRLRSFLIRRAGGERHRRRQEYGGRCRHQVSISRCHNPSSIAPNPHRRSIDLQSIG
jgi:hypothetical protein